MRYRSEDSWKLAFVLALGTIILLFFMALILHPTSRVVYIGEGNIFDKSFTEPFETLYLVFYNGDFLSFSTHEENAVSISPHNLIAFLDEEGKRLEDVVIMAHNHPVGLRLSQKNSFFMKRLRGLGFKGSFCVYVTSSGRVRCDRGEN